MGSLFGHSHVLRRVWFGLLVVIINPWSATAWATGTVEGRLTHADGGTPIGGASVQVGETNASTVTDQNGRYNLSLPAGTYTLVFSLADFSDARTIVVADDMVTTVDHVATWALEYADTVIVEGASRRADRLIDAPASVSVVDATLLETLATQAQLPRLMESVPGLEIVRSGLFDFNVNARGFNGALNRRMLVLVDGRDPNGVLVGAQDWGALGILPETIARIEVIRGPGSALYGSKAFNGVISFVSRAPRDAPGGSLRISGGERSTAIVSGSHAGRVSGRWTYRVFGQYARSRDFYRARVSSVEYSGLTRELVPPRPRTEIMGGGIRVDGHWAEQRALTLEGGDTRIDGHVFVTPAGRSQNDGIRRPWVRSRLVSGPWNVSSYWDARRGRNFSLALNIAGYEKSDKADIETLRVFSLPDGLGSLVAGGSFQYSRFDSRDPRGVHTIVRDIHSGRSIGGFAQSDLDLSSDLSVVLAARVDGSTLHPTQVSPKAGLVYALGLDQALRVTFGRAFQSGTFSELFLRIPVAPPVGLEALEQALAPVLGDVRLGLGNVPVLLVGNERLRVETVGSLDVGYTGVIGRRFVVSGDYYRGRLDDFISSSLPQVGTSLGRINPDYGPYRPPASLSAAQQAAVLAAVRAALPPDLFALLSNEPDGSPAFIAFSLGNFGRVDTQGADIGVQYSGRNGMRADASYSWFHFTVRNDLAEQPLQANTAPHRIRAGLAFTRGRYSSAVRYRWSDTFRWVQGQLVGQVPQYAAADVIGEVRVSAALAARLDVSNVLDSRHFEIFGGDILGRRALVELIVRWR